jgi:alkanesulfonate monooxygenase SsuD/methylene tetrahydromethanopterin reductase-like flavin-dependent oxidoreductase (luciferase family)
MPQLMLRYDMRQPAFSDVPRAELYQAAIEQCAWGEQQGITSVHLSEHHGSDDGYCPSPLLLASAIAGRTEAMMIYISALIAPLHDPVRLAEDMAVVDLISKGRVFPVFSAGYREEEFTAVGKSLKDRKAYMDDIGPFLKQAWSGEPFDYQGRTITVTPKPHSEPRPPILMGGSSRPAARRAAEHADFFIPTGPEIFEYYREALKAKGKPDPGPMPAAPSTLTFVAEDPDAYWDQIARHVQHETNCYRAWADKAGIHNPYLHYDDLDELRAGDAYRVYTPLELIEAAREMPKPQPIMLHPLCGGISPELAWSSLELFDDAVLPTLKEEGLLI